ncbi:MAG: hypothetical protein MZV64_70760 [Ignavibacteriales bacterium]|nr:hypothetical protein [Ignavibacteriales bacterium]
MVKLTRGNLFMAPVIVVLSSWSPGARPGGRGPRRDEERRRPAQGPRCPGSSSGFVAMAVLNSLGASFPRRPWM